MKQLICNVFYATRWIETLKILKYRKVPKCNAQDWRYHIYMLLPCQNLTIYKAEACLESCEISKMELFCKIILLLSACFYKYFAVRICNHFSSCCCIWKFIKDDRMMCCARLLMILSQARGNPLFQAIHSWNSKLKLFLLVSSNFLVGSGYFAL